MSQPNRSRLHPGGQFHWTVYAAFDFSSWELLHTHGSGALLRGAAVLGACFLLNAKPWVCVSVRRDARGAPSTDSIPPSRPGYRAASPTHGGRLPMVRF